jgi:hypothetical protein
MLIVTIMRLLMRRRVRIHLRGRRPASIPGRIIVPIFTPIVLLLRILLVRGGTMRQRWMSVRGRSSVVLSLPWRVAVCIVVLIFVVGSRRRSGGILSCTFARGRRAATRSVRIVLGIFSIGRIFLVWMSPGMRMGVSLMRRGGVLMFVPVIITRVVAVVALLSPLFIGGIFAIELTEGGGLFFGKVGRDSPSRRSSGGGYCCEDCGGVFAFVVLLS